MKVKLTLEYSGEPFAGWQTQPGLLTVQSDLERSLQVMFASWAKKQNVAWDKAVAITGSGRTDAGVHARGQVASFSWPEEFNFDPRLVLNSLNGISVPELIIRRVESADDGFDARFSPHAKCYQYRLLLRDQREGLEAGRVWGVGSRLDVRAMIEAAKLFGGQHDFSSFRASDCTAKSTERTILLSEITRVSDEEVVFTAHGKGFLKQMIRIMVGTLVDVGKGKLTIADVQRILDSRNRSLAGQTAPACGLTLEWVRYF